MTAKERIYNFIVKNQGVENVDSIDIAVGTLVRPDICIELLHELQDEGKIVRINKARSYYEVCNGQKCKECLKPTLLYVNPAINKCCNCGFIKQK